MREDFFQRRRATGLLRRLLLAGACAGGLFARSGCLYELRSGNAANSTSYLYLMGVRENEAGIRQTGYLPVERELEYRGSLFVSAAEGAVTLTVSFQRHDHPDDVLATAILAVPDDHKWVKLPFHLALPAGSVAPLDGVDFAVGVDGGARVSLDEVRLYQG